MNLRSTINKTNVIWILFNICLVIPFFEILAYAHVHTAVDWKGGKRELKYYVRSTESEDFFADVDTAIQNWNKENTGWKFLLGSRSDHDILIQSDSIPGSCGVQRFNVSMKIGVFSVVDTAEILISNIKKWSKVKGAGPCRIRVIMHELGHCCRLMHSKPTEIMDIMLISMNS